MLFSDMLPKRFISRFLPHVCDIFFSSLVEFSPRFTSIFQAHLSFTDDTNYFVADPCSPTNSDLPSVTRETLFSPAVLYLLCSWLSCAQNVTQLLSPSFLDGQRNARIFELFLASFLECFGQGSLRCWWNYDDSFSHASTALFFPVPPCLLFLFPLQSLWVC